MGLITRCALEEPFELKGFQADVTRLTTRGSRVAIAVTTEMKNGHGVCDDMLECQLDGLSVVNETIKRNSHYI